MEGNEMAKPETLEMLDRLLNAKEAAELLGVSISSIRAWRFKQILPVCLVGRCVRFRLSDLKAIMQKGMSLKK